jgi:hypothetical protein
LRALVFLGAQLVWAQTTVQVQKAQLAIPFGSVNGTLVLAGDMLVFVDEANTGASFGVSRSDITDMRTEGDVLIAELRQPIRDRTGDRNRLTFRLAQPGASAMLPDWWRQKPAIGATATPPAVPAPAGGATPRSGEPLILAVRHDHTVRSGCTGRLIITDDRINYESVSDLDHSRQWNMRDIRELKRKNPYHLEIDGFGEGDYNFNLQGRSLDTDEFRKLVDRIAAARAQR